MGEGSGKGEDGSWTLAGVPPNLCYKDGNSIPGSSTAMNVNTTVNCWTEVDKKVKLSAKEGS